MPLMIFCEGISKGSVMYWIVCFDRNPLVASFIITRLRLWGVRLCFSVPDLVYVMADFVLVTTRKDSCGSGVLFFKPHPDPLRRRGKLGGCRWWIISFALRLYFDWAHYKQG